MKKQTSGNIRLGLFVSISTIVLVLALYMIGSKRSMFSNTIRVQSEFYNVNGLMPGNNVRYAGIDIGTVDKVRIENDSSVTVYLLIEKQNSQYIRKNSIAAIGTDGLMGNKLVNINPGTGLAPPIQDGDELPSLRPVENEEMVRTLNTTNNNLAAITTDLRKFTSRLNKDKGVLKLIEDSVATENIRLSLVAIRDAAINASNITAQLNQLAGSLNRGEGLAGMLLKDTLVEIQLQKVIVQLGDAADSLSEASNALSEFATGLNNPSGLSYTITRDTALAADVKSGINNLEEGTVLLNENLKAMRENWLFRKYFRDQEKKSGK